MKKLFIIICVASILLLTSCEASCEDNKYLDYIKGFFEEVQEDFEAYNSK